MIAADIRTLQHGVMADFHDGPYPTMVYGYVGTPQTILGSGTAYGFAEGEVTASVDYQAYEDLKDSYFSLPANKQIKLRGRGHAFFAFRLGYRGLHLIGRGLEPRGRLRYIDGCSDTLLIAPPLRGDPCLNLLHFPPGISQTRHTHPTVRVGMIHAGNGFCHTDAGTSPLNAGSVFILAPDAVHAFETRTESMQLTVYHPDTDFGPTHEEHPMLNRTIVDGVSAREIDAIRTKEIQ